MAWACDRCGRLHTQNPSECRQCGHSTFSPVSERDLERRRSTRDAPESTTVEYTVGTPPDEERSSSPDVNPDGSIAGDEPRAGEERESNSVLGWLRARLPF